MKDWEKAWNSWRDRTGLHEYSNVARQAFEAGWDAMREAHREVYSPELKEISYSEGGTMTAYHPKSATVEHYTPSHIVDLVVECLGVIDIDPCADPGRGIPAGRHYTKEQDGLKAPWVGRLFINPPYGRGIDRWARKLEDSPITEAIVLVPARTDTEWFRLFSDIASCVCFIRGRLTFGDAPAPAPFPSALFYVGRRGRRFERIFAKVGDIWR